MNELPGFRIKKDCGREILNGPEESELVPGREVYFNILDLFADAIPTRLVSVEQAANPTARIIIADSILRPEIKFWISYRPSEKTGILQILEPI